MSKLFDVLYTCFLAVLLLVTSCNTAPDTQTASNIEAQPVAAKISANGFAASCPYLTKDQYGNSVLSWVQATDTTGNYLVYYAISEDGGKTFGMARSIPATKGVHPHDENLSKILFRKNGDMMVMFAVSNPSAENSYAGLVYYTQSYDNGSTWTKPRQIAEDTLRSTDERYFDMELSPDGEVSAIWLDSRKTTDNEGSSLYFASTKGRNGFVGEKVIDTQLCQCCRTDLFLDQQAKLHVAYRGIQNDSIRDMMYLVSKDGGKSFSKPERISHDNWVIYGCPHTGPALAANQNGTHYAWFTMGSGSGVYYTQKQGGVNFVPKEVVSNSPAARHPQMTSYGIGKLAIVWDERSQEPSSRVSLQLRNEKGEYLSTTIVTQDSVNALYPVILPVDKHTVLVAYTVKGDKPDEVWYQRVEVQE